MDGKECDLTMSIGATQLTDLDGRATANPLLEAATNRGWRPSPQGNLQLKVGKRNLTLVRSPDECLTVSCPCEVRNAGKMLSRHANWPGPVKLVRLGGRGFRRLELCTGGISNNSYSLLSAEEERRDTEAVLDELLGRVPDYFRRMPKVRDWVSPDPKCVADWLVKEGYRIAIDESGNIRLTLRRHGHDGQIQIRRDDGGLRMSMRLGAWRDLARTSEAAILRLAAEANARTRLARIVWIVDGQQRRCEAQVDLTGLPVGVAGKSLSGARVTLWKEMVMSGVEALNLILKRLGLELSALARNPDLAKVVELTMTEVGRVK